MILSFNKIITMLIPVLISVYTMSYTLWLWDKREKLAALGVALLAVLSLVYPGYVLFFVHV